MIKDSYQDIRYFTIPLCVSILAVLAKQNMDIVVLNEILDLFLLSLKEQIGDATVKIVFFTTLIVGASKLIFSDIQPGDPSNIKHDGALSWASNIFVTIFSIVSGLMLGQGISGVIAQNSTMYFYFAWGSYAAFFVLCFMLIVESILTSYHLALTSIFKDYRTSAKIMGYLILLIAVHGIFTEIA